MPGAALLLTQAPPGTASGSAVRAAQTRAALASVYERVDVVSLARAGDRAMADPAVHLVERVRVTGRSAYGAALLRGGSGLVPARAAGLERRIRALVRAGDLLPRYDLVVPHFLVMARAALTVPAAARLLDLDMSYGAELGRIDTTASSRRGRAFTRADAAAARRAERRLCARHDVVVVATEPEADVVSRFHPRVEVVPNTAPDPGVSATPVADRGSVLFVGTLDYRPNIEGALFLCRHVAPLLHARMPDARIEVVGRSPVPEVRAACAEAGVALHADVPALAPFYAGARCVVAPLWGGGGSRIKLIEAMAHGSAIVATERASDGIAIEAGSDYVRAESADEFASAIVALLEDPAAAEGLARNARAAYERSHHPDAFRDRMVGLTASLRG